MVNSRPHDELRPGYCRKQPAYCSRPRTSSPACHAERASTFSRISLYSAAPASVDPLLALHRPCRSSHSLHQVFSTTSNARFQLSVFSVSVFLRDLLDLTPFPYLSDSTQFSTSHHSTAQPRPANLTPPAAFRFCLGTTTILAPGFFGNVAQWLEHRNPRSSVVYVTNRRYKLKQVSLSAVLVAVLMAGSAARAAGSGQGGS